MNRIQFVETFVRREEAERFIEEVRGDDPDIASYLRRRATKPKTDCPVGIRE